MHDRNVAVGQRGVTKLANHCGDLDGDRAIGTFWEHEFCKLATRYNRSFTAHQIGRPKSAQAFYRENGKYRPMTLPDITIWTRPGEHHEVKHKYPTLDGMFGLERYRLDALLWFAEETGQSVYYTIHNYALQDGDLSLEKKKQLKTNLAEHWLTCAVPELAQCIDKQKPGFSYVNGQKKEVDICYWTTSKFQPVVWLWKAEPAGDNSGWIASHDKWLEENHDPLRSM